jgi:hypothetical protein
MTLKEAETKRIAAALLEKVEYLREEAKERQERFEALTNEQIVKKITGETSNPDNAR